MKNQLKLWSGYLAFVFLLASCAPTAHIEKDENADLGRYKSFAWIGKKDKESGEKTSDLTEQKIREAVTKELEKAGWHQSSSKPDVLLSYDLLVERSVKERSDPRYSFPFYRTFYNPYSGRFFNVYYPSRFIGYDRREYSTREGTITVSMIDAKTEKMVWQGWATDEVNNRNLTTKEIQSSVRAIFRKFDLAKN